MRTWYIYKITNLLNNKCYVGQRKLPFNKTIITDNYMGSGVIIKQSIKKNGIENFKKEILKDNIYCLTAANIFEEISIKKENSLFPIGYNIKKSSLRKTELSEEVKLKISASSRGRVMSNETKEKIRKKNLNRDPSINKKISESSKKMWTNMSNETRSHYKNKIITEETKSKISNTLMGHNVSTETRQKISNTLKYKNKLQRNLELEILKELLSLNITTKNIMVKMDISEAKFYILKKIINGNKLLFIH